MSYTSNLPTVTGLTEVQEMLDKAPGVIVLQAFTRALSAGGFVILKQLVANTPERKEENTRSEDQRSLREYADMIVTLDSQGRGGQVEVGFTGYGGRIANWLERGHWSVNVHKGGSYKDDKGRSRPGQRVRFVPPDPFMSRAAEVSANAAVQAFEESLVEALRELL